LHSGHCIRISPNSSSHYATPKNKPDDVQNLFNLALYYLANHQSDLSKRIYQQGLKHGAKASQIQEAVQDLEEFLKVFS
jgi:hypothetical protein